MYAYDPRGNLTNATTLDPGLSNLDFSVMSYDAADRLTNITSAVTAGGFPSPTIPPVVAPPASINSAIGLPTATTSQAGSKA